MNHRYIHTLIFASAALLVAGILDDQWPHAADLRLVAAVGLLAGLGESQWRRLPRSTEAAYQLGRADGHREGYDEGRRAKLAVVPFRCPTCAGDGGNPPVTDRRRRGSPMRVIVEPVESAECSKAGADSPN